MEEKVCAFGRRQNNNVQKLPEQGRSKCYNLLNKLAGSCILDTAVTLMLNMMSG